MERYLYLKNPWWENKKFDSGVARPEYLDSLKKNFNQKLIQILTGLRNLKTTQKMDGFKVNAVPLRDFLLRPQGLL